MRALHILVLLLAACAGFAAPVHAVELQELEGRLPLGRHAWVQDLSAADLAAWLDDPDAWLADQQPLPRATPLQTLTTDAAATGIWRRNGTDKLWLDAPSRFSRVLLDLNHSGMETLDLVLELAGIDGLGWRYRDHDGVWRSHSDASDSPRGGRDYLDVQAVLPLRLEPGQQLRLELFAYTILDAKHASLNLWDANAWRAQRMTQNLVDGIYFGLVGALLLYSLFLYGAKRQGTYLYFAAFIAASAGMIYVGSGLAQVFGLQHTPRWTLTLTFLFQGLVGALSGLFSISLLDIRNTNRPLFQLWLVVVAVNLLLTPWIVFNAWLGSYSVSGVGGSVALLIGLWLFNQLVNLTTLWHYRHHARLVLYWFLAVTLHTWVLAFWPLVLNSAFNPVLAPYHLAQLATLVDTLVMAILIAHDLRSEQDSRLRAQRSAVENLRLAHDIERAKSNFVATVGHDLRSPVQAISHFTQSMKLQADQTQRANLDKIDDNLRTISELLDGMVKLSQSEWQGLKPHAVPLPLGKLLQELQAEFTPRAEHRGLRFECPDTDIWVSSDRVCLSQILRNLIDNALKFTSTGSICIGISDSGQQVVLRVQDSGCGIPESALPRIFDEFYQVPGSQTGGVGLGLSIVARLSRLLDIGVQAQSQAGAGSCFELTIPRAAAGREAEPAMVPPAPDVRLPGSLTGLRVLVLGTPGSRPDSPVGMLQRWGAELCQLDSPLALLVHLREQLLMSDLIVAEAQLYRGLERQLQPDDLELLRESAPLLVCYPTADTSATDAVATPHIAMHGRLSPMQFRSLLQRELRRDSTVT